MSAVRLIPWVLHEAWEYLVGVFLILAPFVFFGDGFGDGLDTAAFPLFVGVGVLLVVLSLLTPGQASIAEVLPIRAHATIDYLLALFLIVSPFMFGLTAAAQPDAAMLIPILLGVIHLVVTLVTRFPLDDAPAPAATAGDGDAETASSHRPDPAASSSAPGEPSSAPGEPAPRGKFGRDARKGGVQPDGGSDGEG